MNKLWYNPHKIKEKKINYDDDKMNRMKGRHKGQN